MKYKKAYIEITNVCNLNCDFCPKNKRQKEYITVEKYTYLINQVKRQTNFLYFHVMGEPLLHPEIDKLLDIADEHAMKVNITTNGFLVKEKLEKIIDKPALRKISFSLHSYESNEEIVEKGMENYIEDILKSCDELSQKNVICVLKLWNLDTENLKGKNKYNRKICDLIQNYFNLKDDIYEVILKNKSMKLKNKVFIQVANKFQWPDKDLENENENIKCLGMIDQFGVLVDGTVIPCCLDNDGNINLGNVYEEDLEKILLSTRAKEISKCNKMGIAKENLCKRCLFANQKK